MLLFITISGLFVKAGIDNSEFNKFYLRYYGDFLDSTGDLTDSSSSPRSLNFEGSYVKLPVFILYFDNLSSEKLFLSMTLEMEFIIPFDAD